MSHAVQINYEQIAVQCHSICEVAENQVAELDKMLAVCDVTSALVLPRSYKDPLSKAQVIDILTDKAQKGELDKTYTDAVISCYVKRSDNVNVIIAIQITQDLLFFFVFSFIYM